jgi:hypothetical protein
MVREGAIVDAIRRYLRSVGAYVEKNHGSALNRGRPDLTGCWPDNYNQPEKIGRFFAFEVKVPGQKPTAIQQHVLNEVSNAGGIAACVHSVDEVKECLRNL